MPIATIAAPYTVAGCAFAPPAGNGPCVTAQWVVGALQVLSQGQPVAIMTGVAACVLLVSVASLPAGNMLIMAAIFAAA